MRWEGVLAPKDEMRNTHKFLSGNPKGTGKLQASGRYGKIVLKLILKKHC
jgi:hypothetical protein